MLVIGIARSKLVDGSKHKRREAIYFLNSLNLPAGHGKQWTYFYTRSNTKDIQSIGVAVECRPYVDCRLSDISVFS